MARDHQLYGVKYNTTKGFRGRVEVAKNEGKAIVPGHCSECDKPDTVFSLESLPYTEGVTVILDRDGVCLNCGEITQFNLGIVN